jgi:hypothetical protein
MIGQDGVTACRYGIDMSFLDMTVSSTADNKSTYIIIWSSDSAVAIMTIYRLDGVRGPGRVKNYEYLFIMSSRLAQGPSMLLMQKACFKI